MFQNFYAKISGKNVRAACTSLISSIALVPSVAFAQTIEQCSNATSAVLQKTNIQSIIIHEKSGSVQKFTFAVSDVRLTEDTNQSGTENDFSTTANEYYDIFVSDASGNVDANGSYITVESINSNTGTNETTGGNIDAIELRLSTGQKLYADQVSAVTNGTGISGDFATNNGYVSRAVGAPDNSATNLGDGASALTVGFCAALDATPVVDISLDAIGPINAAPGDILSYTITINNPSSNFVSFFNLDNVVSANVSFIEVSPQETCHESSLSSIYCNNIEVGPHSSKEVVVEYNLDASQACNTTINAYSIIQNHNLIDTVTENNSKTVSTNVVCTACQDGVDNDGDGLVDMIDSGCNSASDDSESNVNGPMCDNGIDDDGDGLIDSLDPGCSSAVDGSEYSNEFACDNNIDDDADGKKDFKINGSGDPDCSSPYDQDEIGTTSSSASSTSTGSSSSESSASSASSESSVSSVSSTSSASSASSISSSSISSQISSSISSITSSSSPQVTLLLKDSKDPVDIGEVFTYTLEVKNLEPTTIVKNEVKLVLDNDLIFLSAAPNADISGGIVTWSNIQIGSNLTVPLTVTVKVKDSALAGSLLNSTAFGSPQDSETTEIRSGDEKEISVSIKDDRDPAEPGDIVTYTITLENKKSTDAKVDVFAKLDDHLSFISATNGGQEEDQDEIQWNNIEVDGNDTEILKLKARVRNNTSKSVVRVEVEVDSDLASDIERTQIRDTTYNTGSSSSHGRGIYNRNYDRNYNTRLYGQDFTRFFQEPIYFEGPVEASIELNANQQEAQPGSIVHYTVTIRNHGNAQAQSVHVRSGYDPQSLEILDAQGGQVLGDHIAYYIPVLGPNETHVLHYRARIVKSLGHGSIIVNGVDMNSPDFERPASDSIEVRIINQLPQTGIKELTASITGNKNIMLKKTEPESSTTNPLVLIISIITGGVSLGAMSAKKILFF